MMFTHLILVPVLGGLAVYLLLRVHQLQKQINAERKTRHGMDESLLRVATQHLDMIKMLSDRIVERLHDE